MRVPFESRIFRIGVSFARALALGTFVFAAILSFGLRANTQSEGAIIKTRAPRPQFIPGELLVRFRSEGEAEREQKQGGKLQIEGREAHISIERPDAADILEGLRFVRVDSEDTLKAVAAFSVRSDVLYAEPNYVRESFRVPNDQYYSVLWGLHNNGTLFGYPGPTEGADIDAEQAWDITTGSRDVVVGVVDGGIDVNHPDLQQNIWNNPGELTGNGLDDDNNGFVDDANGFDFFHNRGEVFNQADLNSEIHATHVAGTIGAVGNNGIGVVGVNWQVSLMSLKIFGRDDESPYPSSVGLLVRAYAYAKKMRDLWLSSGGTRGANIRVLNNSIGGYGFSQTELDTVRALNDSGILFVAAAGNYTRNNDTFPVYPAGYESPNVISVAASALFDQLALFSNFGTRTVSLSAPGYGIFSTTPNNNYDTLNGTSMASPHVAGAAALICAVYPDISVARLRAALIFNGDFIPSQAYRTLTGRRLNALKALQAVAENDNTPPAGFTDFRIVSQNGRTITLAWTASGDDVKTGTASLYDIRFSDSDPGIADQFEAATPISPLTIPIPSVAGTWESATVEVPIQHTRGFVGLRATDNMGNSSPVAVVRVSVAENLANPYEVTESVPQPLSIGGTRVQYFLSPDDAYSYDYELPFAFPFFGRLLRNVTVSTNGTLYFATPPKFLLPPVTSNGSSLDAYSSVRALQTNMMIAGMWDDLVITGVYVVIPDSNRIIFRWEGTTFDTPFDDGTSRGQLPISFEMELRRDGTIQIRYGDGNQKLFPVVGISSGSLGAYAVTSHTSEDSFMSLTNANTVTFSPRIAPAPTSADVSIVLSDLSVVTPVPSGGNIYTTLPVAATPGQTIQYRLTINDLGPDATDNVIFTSQLAPGTSFVNCGEIGLVCSGPPPDTDGGTVTINFGTLGQIYNRRAAEVRIQVRINAPAGTTLKNTITVSSSTPDLNLTNNKVEIVTPVADFGPFGEVIAVDGNNGNTIALRQDGTVWFWGLPFGSSDSPDFCVTTPKRVLGLSNIIAIVTGGSHALALRSDGTVWSWGVNDSGQLGHQPVSTSALSPTQIPGLNNIQSIATASPSSFAVGVDGTVWAWGDNLSGQLGDGTTTRRTTPVHLTSIFEVRSISTNGECTYAVKQDGTVWSWGSNRFGLLGTGSSDSLSLVPVKVAALANIRVVATQDFHAVALRDDGSAWTWGNGGSGQLGNGSTNDSAVPVQVTGLTGCTAVAASSLGCLALKADGTVWSWGEGQLTPALVAGLAGVKRVGAWWIIHAAILADNTLQMWGANNAGALGDGTFTSRSTPGPVKFLSVVGAPTFSPGGSSYVFPQDVVINCDTEGAVIHYTTSGVDPTENDSIIASGATIRIDHSGVIKARAWKSGWSPSMVGSGAYTITATGNLIDEPWSFVRQHYLDFLSREPDQGGWDYWISQITQCGFDSDCIRTQRIGVSAAFFIELEFQQTGYVVYRFYRASYGTRPNAPTRAAITFQQFIADRALLVGGSGLPQNTINLANNFVMRPEFKAMYPDDGSMTNAQFVNKLFDTASLTPYTAERQQQIAAMDQNGKTRAQVLLDVIEISEFKTREYNPAFVLMQYYGYLRRNPDQNGYDFWLNILNSQPNNFGGMVCSFLTSTEYQHRFGTAITRSNQDCSQ